jgi:site-specific DNA recombinase
MKPTTPSPTAKQVGIWIRVSTDDQAQGDSPEHHEQRAREYAKFNDWNVREVYDLAGVSGKTVMEHPEAKRMLADIKRGHISALIFSKLARLARNTKELLDFSELFRVSHADMVSLQEKIDTSTPAGRLFYTMIAAMAQWEREEIGDRVRASVAIRAKLGKRLGGPPPYGYRWIEKKLTLEPTEGTILKQAFDLFLQHRRKGSVARLLNKAGLRTRTGAQWSDTTIARLLTQSAAKGIYFTNTMRKTGGWTYETKPEDQWGRIEVTPVISEDVWHQASQILEEQGKKPARLGKVPVKIFGGLTVCHCGYKMYVPSRSRKYTCEKCKNKILAEDLEAIFYEKLKAYFVAPERIAARLASARQGLEEKEARLTVHQREIQKVREEMTRTHRLYLDGQIPLESFGGYHKPLEAQLLQLQNELPKLEAEVTHLKIRDLSADEERTHEEGDGEPAAKALDVTALSGENAQLTGDAGEHQNSGVDARERDIEKLGLVCPDTGVHRPQREVHREQGREEHQLAGQPDDRADRHHVGPVGRGMGVGRGDRCVGHGAILADRGP